MCPYFEPDMYRQEFCTKMDMACACGGNTDHCDGLEWNDERDITEEEIEELKRR